MVLSHLGGIKRIRQARLVFLSSTVHAYIAEWLHETFSEIDSPSDQHKFMHLYSFSNWVNRIQRYWRKSDVGEMFLANIIKGNRVLLPLLGVFSVYIVLIGRATLFLAWKYGLLAFTYFWILIFCHFFLKPLYVKTFKIQNKIITRNGLRIKLYAPPPLKLLRRIYTYIERTYWLKSKSRSLTLKGTSLSVKVLFCRYTNCIAYAIYYNKVRNCMTFDTVI